MSFEASRKHGPFDTRWPSGRRDASTGEPSAPPRLRLVTPHDTVPPDIEAASALGAERLLAAVVSMQVPHPDER